MNNTALQTSIFDFYGDELIALKDNATGEIYTSINSVLKGIGFTNKNQIRKRRDKWVNDIVISKGIMKFNIPTQEVVSQNGITLFDEKETFCISQRKLPLSFSKNQYNTNNEKESTRISIKIRTIPRQMCRCPGIRIH